MIDIIEPIYKEDIGISDLSGLNPNVMNELGIAHTFNKKTNVITKDDLSLLPFDLKQYRVRNYSIHFSKFEELIEYLDINMDRAVNGSIFYSDLVKDFIKFSDSEGESRFTASSLQLKKNKDKGFLVGIEESIDCMCKQYKADDL